MIMDPRQKPEGHPRKETCRERDREKKYVSLDDVCLV